MAAEASSSSTQNDAAQPARYALAQSILGDEAFKFTNTAKVLVVGAGGIGCELLKNLVLTGFGNIEIIDLDTIDLSNLNRQFLFQKQHIKKPKSLVAKQTASSFNPLPNIVAYHANIKEPRFGVAYFQSFDLVMNALDNLDARRWVNQMCIAADVPLIESGTTGFQGQVQPIRRGLTECYDCVPKPTPKTFPVCTIRSTPSTPIHCIVWAKSWLFTQLFGADDETEDQELDKAIADGEDAQEIDSLRKEAREMRDIRASLVEAAKNGDQDAVRAVAERIFNKVYKNDIERLLGMEEMWTHRPVKPVPLVYQDALSGVPAVDSTDSTASTAPQDPSASAPDAASTTNGANASKLKDQRTLTLKDNVELFLSSVSSLAIRAAADLTQPLSFDKDDEDALDFVTASSNLRSIVYHIDRKTRFEVKQMAGNIIPAIASTNAIIAGLLALQALHALSGKWDKMRWVSLARGDKRMITSWPPSKPNPRCGVCQDVYIPIVVASLEDVTLEVVVDKVAKEALGMGEEDLVVYNGNKILADPDFEDNLGKSLKEMGLEKGSILTIMDEDQLLQAVNVVISVRSGEAQAEVEAVKILTTELSRPKQRPPKIEADTKADSDDSDNDDVPMAVEVADLVVKPINSVVGKKRPLPDDQIAPSEITTADQMTTFEKKQKTTQPPPNTTNNNNDDDDDDDDDGSNKDTAIILE
ncbi:related to ubiquitin-like protein activating enzyme [Ustilago trichophora]|uniref:Ubiquitin-activating enzyme E1-like n=1 Tax=Ustilago trichophora TaxID=86804 RepID=A0A5C3DWU8_9BASI|nr:related to ubiquitin-like protein activating enzyme [Ustilago trichophora]